MRASLLAAAAALLVASPAAAQPGQYGFEEIASDLVWGFCPLFLADRFALDGPELAERGFDKAVQKQPHPRFGELHLVGLKRAEGEIGFGGAPGQFCTAVVAGGSRESTLKKLRETMSWTGLNFAPTPHTGAQIPGTSVEAFKAAADSQFLYVQLIQAGGPKPVLIVQMFAMGE